MPSLAWVTMRLKLTGYLLLTADALFCIPKESMRIGIHS
jgi:hypothetical protein